MSTMKMLLASKINGTTYLMRINFEEEITQNMIEIAYTKGYYCGPEYEKYLKESN